MNKYTELKDKHSKMVNEFPMAFAFSNEQFEQAKQKLGVKSNDELLGIAGGGMIRKTDLESYRNLHETITEENENAFLDDEYLYQGLLYELANHEYGITYCADDTLDCFCLTMDDVRMDERIYPIFKRAQKDYLDTFVY